MMTVASGWLSCGLVAAPGSADREQSVAAGREALDRWIWQYPWYDSQTDGVRAIEVSQPWYLKWKWLLEWLEDLFSFGGLTASVPWLKWVAWPLIAALLIVLVCLAVRALRNRKRRKSAETAEAKRAGAAEQRRRIEALPPGARQRANLRAEARRHYEQGDYAQAITCLFSYQLIQLDKNQLIRLTRGKTNRQYLRELGGRTALRRLLEQTMVAFEEVFFGNYAIDRVRFESVWSRLDQFETLAAGGAA